MRIEQATGEPVVSAQRRKAQSRGATLDFVCTTMAAVLATQIHEAEKPEEKVYPFVIFSSVCSSAFLASIIFYKCAGHSFLSILREHVVPGRRWQFLLASFFNLMGCLFLLIANEGTLSERPPTGFLADLVRYFFLGAMLLVVGNANKKEIPETLKENAEVASATPVPAAENSTEDADRFGASLDVLHSLMASILSANNLEVEAFEHKVAGLLTFSCITLGTFIATAIYHIRSGRDGLKTCQELFTTGRRWQFFLASLLGLIGFMFWSIDNHGDLVARPTNQPLIKFTRYIFGALMILAVGDASAKSLRNAYQEVRPILENIFSSQHSSQSAEGITQDEQTPEVVAHEPYEEAVLQRTHSFYRPHELSATAVAEPERMDNIPVVLESPNSPVLLVVRATTTNLPPRPPNLRPH